MKTSVGAKGKEKGEAAHPPAPPVERRADIRLAAARCPFCHEDVHPDALDGDPAVACERCLSRHHEACWKEGRRCAACGGKRRLRRGLRVGVDRGTTYLLAGGVAFALLVLCGALLLDQQARAARRAADAAIARERADRERVERELAREAAALEVRARFEASRRAVAMRQAAQATREAEEAREADDDAWEARERARREAAVREAEAAERARELTLRTQRLLRDATSLARAGYAEEAARTYAALLALDPEHRTALGNLAVVLVRLGRADEAIATCDRALRLDEAHVEAWVARASAKVLAGDLRGARADLDRALAIHPTYATALANRAEVRRRLGDEAGAAADAEAARRLRVGGTTWLRFQ